MPALEEASELARRMARQLDQHARLRTLLCKPVRERLLAVAALRQHRERSAQPVVEHGDGGLIGLQQSEWCTRGIAVNLLRQGAQILPAVEYRKHYQRAQGEDREI